MSAPRWDREGRHWPHRASSCFVEAAGLCWHVQQMGSGPDVVLIHGTAAATHSWRGLMPLLAEAYSVTALDLPGHGFTSAPRAEGYRMPAMAHAVSTLLDTIGVRPTQIVGHSAGAAIAARLALDYGHNVPIVAINGALLPFPGAARVAFPALAQALVMNPFVPRLVTIAGQSKTFVARFLEKATGSRIDAEGAKFYQSLFACSDHCAAALAMMAQWDLDSLKRDLPRLTSPLLLIAARNDAAIPLSVADQVAGLVPGAQVQILERLGHLSHEESPKAVLDIILDFAKAHEL
jgi:magnesium chelatase accessory protein